MGLEGGHSWNFTNENDVIFGWPLTCCSNKVIAPNTFKCISMTILSVPSCKSASFLCVRYGCLPKLFKCSCLKHKKEAFLQDETFRRVNQMHLKVFGAITLLLQQVTINGWKWLSGAGFWNTSQKNNQNFCLAYPAATSWYQTGPADKTTTNDQKITEFTQNTWKCNMCLVCCSPLVPTGQMIIWLYVVVWIKFYHQQYLRYNYYNMTRFFTQLWINAHWWYSTFIKCIMNN